MPAIEEAELFIDNEVRRTGLHIPAPQGHGKSRLLGRGILYQDFTAKNAIPMVVIDPPGQTINNFLDKVGADKRVTYFDMSGHWDYVPGFPLYYRLKGDSLRDVAQRFISTLVRADPNLIKAPTTGKNALEEIGVNAGMVLASLGLQVNAMPSLLQDVKSWRPRLDSLLGGEADPAARFFIYDYPKVPPYKKDVMLTKLIPFTHDEKLMAMFSSPVQTIEWDEVIKQKRAVLFEFGDDNMRHFKIFWVLNNFMEYARRRGPSRKRPVSLVIDELAALIHLDSQNELLASDLNELIAIIGRNYNIWTTVSHQEMHQIPKILRPTLMSMGNQILGATTDDGTAMDYARRFGRYSPERIKQVRAVHMVAPDSDNSLSRSRSIQVVDYHKEIFSPYEQLVLDSHPFRDLERFEFLAAVTNTEGTISNTLTKFNIHKLDEGNYPNEKKLERIKQRLVKRSGRSIGDLLSLINGQQTGPQPAFTAQPRVGRKPGVSKNQTSPSGHNP